MSKKRKIMRSLALAAALAITSIGSAAAETMQSSFGNTIVLTDDQGVQTRLLFEPDGHYVAVLADGTRVPGAWEVVGADFCMTPEGGTRGCAPHTSDKNLGDTWTQTNVDGRQITLSIVAGRN